MPTRRPGPALTIAVTLIVVSLVGCGPNAGTPPASPGSTHASAAPGAVASASPTARVIALNGAVLAGCDLRDGSNVVRARCGRLTVPEDRSKPAGRTIALSVAVVPAISASPAADPLFILAGGPGGAATQMSWTSRVFAGTHATRDIVLVDQRGTGDSNEHRFGTPPDLSGLSGAALVDARRAWLEAQLKGFDFDPTMYTTAPAMDDLDAVRAALGYDRIDLYGGSYGATAAQYYIRQHGEHLRTVILDGATLIDVPVMELIAPNSQRALDLLFERCAADPGCAAAYPGLRAEFSAAIGRLAKGDVTTDVSSRLNNLPIVVTATGFAATVHAGLVDSKLTAQVPWLIHAVATGQWHAVGVALAALEQRAEGLQVMSGIIRCSEAWAVFDPAAVARLGAGSYYADVETDLAEQQAASCALAPRGVVPANDGARARTTVAVLLTVGDADPQDPPSNIATAPTDFPNSLTLVVPGQGHTVAHIGCVPRIVDAFIAAGTVDGLDTSCVAAGGAAPPPFKLP